MEKTYDRVSCGGVIQRVNTQGKPEILLLHKNKTESWPYDSYHLPKGMMGENETREQTAQREILEETGYTVKIIRELGNLESTYEDDGQIKNKNTHYFLCEPVDQVDKRDQEHDNIQWVSKDEAIDLLSQFPIWEKEEDIVCFKGCS